MNAPERLSVGHTLRAPWCALDDAALLAHFRGPRPVHYFAVADADETHPDRLADILAGRFTFNGESHRMPEPMDWLTNPSADIEWHILLHKGYYLVGLGAQFARTGEQRWLTTWMRLIDSWMSQVPAGFIAADVTGRRVQNWIYSYYHVVSTSPHEGVDPVFHRRMLTSLAAQVDYLCDNLTPKRNHRTLELVAIFLASVVFPEMSRASAWREFALTRLVDNIHTDLLPDGVQIELSTDYHQLVTRNYLNVRRLAALNGIAFPAAADAALNRALDFCLHTHKPDGIVPSFSDGDARGFTDVLRMGAELYDRDDLRYAASAGRQGQEPPRAALFPDAGYALIRDRWGHAGALDRDAHFLCFDFGPLGEGNHGHFDALSIELAAHGRSLVVDPGRYTYSEAGPINWRIHFRGTAAHNTVCVDGRNQTRYEPRPVKGVTRHGAGAIRHKVAGPAPDTTLHAHVLREDWALLHASARSHEYDALHQRRVIAVSGHYWLILDALDAPTPHEYALRFQLSEAADDDSTHRHPERAGQWFSPGLLIAQPAELAGAQSLESAWVSPRYGEKLPAARLRTQVRGTRARFATVLYPFAGTPPDLHVTTLDAGPDTAALTCLQIEDATRGVRDLWCSIDAVDGEAVDVTLPEGRFQGRWLWLRTDTAGHITHVHADPQAHLIWQGQQVIPGTPQ